MSRLNRPLIEIEMVFVLSQNVGGADVNAVADYGPLGQISFGLVA